jgi:predicted transcriptional regulator
MGNLSREDAADNAAFDAAMADMPGRAPLPHPMSQAILKGDSLLKGMRQWRDVGQVKLASDIGASQGFIFDLENRRRKLSNDVATRIAAALDIPRHWLI